MTTNLLTKAINQELADLRQKWNVSHALLVRAMLILEALNLSVQWELAPEIKQEIAQLCEEFRARVGAQEENTQ